MIRMGKSSLRPFKCVVSFVVQIYGYEDVKEFAHEKGCQSICLSTCARIVQPTGLHYNHCVSPSVRQSTVSENAYYF